VKILLPLDGSRIAERALDALPSLAKLGPPTIRLVSIIEAIEGLSEVAADERLAREQGLLKGYLDSTVERLRAVYGAAAVDSLLLAGDPADEILSQEATFAPDLLVIGTHGRSGIGRWRIGSVADAVIRRAQSDTLIGGTARPAA
jgi:nucleotide-binding universal stress UspA family protein